MASTIDEENLRTASRIRTLNRNYAMEGMIGGVRAAEKRAAEAARKAGMQ